MWKINWNIALYYYYLVRIAFENKWWKSCKDIHYSTRLVNSFYSLFQQLERSSLRVVRIPNDPLLISAEGDDPRRPLQFLFGSFLLGAVEGHQEQSWRKRAILPEGKNSPVGIVWHLIWRISMSLFSPRFFDFL